MTEDDVLTLTHPALTAFPSRIEQVIVALRDGFTIICRSSRPSDG